jgi:Tfp pilus assembly protein PilV
MQTARKEKRKQNGESGFTLLEVMVSMFCFLIIAMALGALSLSSWKTVNHSRLTTEASVLGSRNIEAILSRVYHDAAIANGTHTATDGIYNVSYTVGDNALLPGSKYVQMNVSYTVGGRTKNVRYHYLLPQRVN